MAKIEFPQDEIPQQPNIGDRYGDIWSSWNLDLASNVGKFRVSPKPAIYTSSDNDPLFVKPFAFVRNMASTPGTQTFFALCDQKVFLTTLGGTVFTKDGA